MLFRACFCCGRCQILVQQLICQLPVLRTVPQPYGAAFFFIAQQQAAGIAATLQQFQLRPGYAAVRVAQNITDCWYSLRIQLMRQERNYPGDHCIGQQQCPHCGCGKGEGSAHQDGRNYINSCLDKIKDNNYRRGIQPDCCFIICRCLQAAAVIIAVQVYEQIYPGQQGADDRSKKNRGSWYHTSFCLRTG